MRRGSLWKADGESLYWPTTLQASSSYAFFFYFDNRYILPSGFDGYRFLGFTVGNCFKQSLTLPNPKSHKFYREKIRLNLHMRNKLRGKCVAFNFNTSTNYPIYLTLGGNINVMYGALRAAEYSGALWSGTMHFSTSNAYDFHASDVRIFPVDNNGRLVGFTVRWS